MPTEVSKTSAAAVPKKAVKTEGRKEKPLHVVKLKRIPYGLFEKQLWEYFTQFGKVVRVRVSRSLKTGNHKGWAYVGFEDKDVAEIAAETMNGYLMFEKRMSCHLMDPAKVPKCMKSGPRYLAPPHMKGRAKKEALKRHQTKTNEQEKKSKARREMALKRRVNKLKAIGIDYEFAAPSSASTPDNKKVAAAKEKAEDDKADATDVAAPLPVKRKMVVKTAKPKVTRVKGRMPPPKKAKKTRK